MVVVGRWVAKRWLRSRTLNERRIRGNRLMSGLVRAFVVWAVVSAVRRATAVREKRGVRWLRSDAI